MTDALREALAEEVRRLKEELRLAQSMAKCKAEKCPYRKTKL